MKTVKMKTVKWLAVHDMMMEQRQEVKNELKDVRDLYVKKRIDRTTYENFKNTTQAKLETIDNMLNELDQIEIEG